MGSQCRQPTLPLQTLSRFPPRIFFPVCFALIWSKCSIRCRIICNLVFHGSVRQKSVGKLIVFIWSEWCKRIVRNAQVGAYAREHSGSTTLPSRSSSVGCGEGFMIIFHAQELCLFH